MRKMFAVILALGGLAAEGARELNVENVRQFFDTAFVVQQKDHEIAGLVVSVVYQDEVLFKSGYGFADLATRTRADPDVSLFRIASITKPFVWTAIMQLVEEGRLALDDPIDQYLDFEIPATFEEPIRVWHLLTHTPGFEEMGTGSTARSVDDVLPLGEHLATNMPARVRPPGRQASYSNYGSAIAGYLIERITGQSWSDYVDENVLYPLSMTSTNTQLLMDAALRVRHAKGYRYSGGQFVANDYEYFSDLPAGHISTTADDMTRFMLAHLNDGAWGGIRILREETARLMYQPLFAPHDAVPPMLHGFYRTDRQGLEIFGHGGDVNQFHSNLSLIPEHDLGIFVSFNSDPGSAARSRLVPAFIDHFFGDEYLPAAPAPADVDLSEYAGEYLALRRNQSTFEKLTMLVSGVTVSAAGGELIVAGGGVNRWIPVGDDVFRAKYFDSSLVFVRDDSGTVSHMVINGPLGTFERVGGFDSPGVVQALLMLVFLVSTVAVLRYGYRLARERGGPKRDQWFATIYSALAILLYGYLGVQLSGNAEEFAYGVPMSAHIVLLVMSANALLGLVVFGLSTRQWVANDTTLVSRVGFSLVAVAALINLWITYYFNILSYVF